ncbi:MAG: mechanosensitive ion channel family protein [Ginsengibacter sp.]|jgi:small-conductance mechanosensitive channel
MKESAKSFTSGLMESMTNYWNKFLLSLPRIIMAIILLVIVIYIAFYIARLIKKSLSGEEHDPLFVRFISKITKVVVIICGIILAMQILGLSGIAGGLLAGAGISAFIFGFAFKDIAENFLGGVILAFNRPFSLNDTIVIREFSGHIVALNFRSTHIKTFDEGDVFIPNSIMVKEPLTNLTRDGKIRLNFMVGIAYEDNITEAIATIEETMKSITDIKQDIKPFTVVEELSVSTVNLKVYFWADTFDYKKGVLQIKSDVITKVKEALEANGFSLPADIQEIKLYDRKEPLPINILNLKDIRERLG